MNNKVITIGRQFGSGGHHIGERLSLLLGIPLYDEHLVNLAAEKLDMDQKDMKSLDEKAMFNLLEAYKTPWNLDTPYFLANYAQPLSDQIFQIQSEVIKELAAKGPCIIVGRCADYILRSHPGLISVFFSASDKDRMKRLVAVRHLEKEEAAGEMEKADTARRNYYETYTGQVWGAAQSYQILLNVSRLGEDKALAVLQSVYEL